MNVFYIGQLWEGGTCLERMKILNKLGHNTIPFNVSLYAKDKSRLIQSVASRFNYGPILNELNKSIVAKHQELKNITHIWIDKGTWIYPDTLRYLKKRTGAIAIHYTPDSQILSQKSRHFVLSIPDYDFMVTTKEWELEHYQKAGAKKVFLTYQGYDDRFYSHKPVQKDTEIYESDVCFIGHTQRHYADRLKSISTLNVKLRVWGDAWPTYAKRHRWNQSIVTGTGLWGESYPKALACAKIGLGLLGKHIPETTTTRTFEIPAMGTFLLAERTPIHQSLFDEGKEAEFFDSDDEMLDKIRYYLANDSLRQKIALKGRERCENSGYSSSKLISKIIEQLQDIS